LNADKLIERAKAEAGRRNYDGAMEYFNQALMVQPDSRGARLGLREAALKKFEHMYPSGASRALSGLGPRMGLAFAGKDPAKRMEGLEKILAKDPKNADLGMKLGGIAEDAGMWGAAAAAYEGILLGNENHVDAMKALGRSLQALGEIADALAILEKAVSVAPRDQMAQRLRKDLAAEAYASDAGFATARTTHDLLRDKDQAKNLEKAQKIVRAEDDLEVRLREAQAAADAAPDDAVAMAELGLAQAALKRYDEAEASLVRSTSISPDDISLRGKLSDVRVAAVERAVIDAQKAADAGDADAAARLPGLEQRRLEVMVAEYKGRVRAHPTDLALRYALAGHLEASGEMDAAIAEYQQAVKDPRRRPDSLGGLGRCFLAKEMYDLAAKQLEKALSEAGAASERRMGLLYDLATVLEKKGAPDKAREYLAQIYEVDIGYRDVSERMQRLKDAAGSA
jgi:tetratricopeptide (TPR) repeat protein